MDVLKITPRGYYHGVVEAIRAAKQTAKARPGEKIRMLGEGEAPEPGAHVEGGTVRDVVYVGMVTRYVVELDDGGELAVISQNFESAEQVLQAKGRRVRLAWRPDQTVTVRQQTEGQPDEEGVGA